MLADVLRDLWSEPAPEPPARTRLDHWLVLGLITLGLLDGLLSDDVAWPTLTIPLMALLPIAVYWRRANTLAVTTVVFGAYAGLHGAMLVAGVTSTFVNAGTIVVMVYTLTRWASGRDAILGLGIAAVGTGLAGSTLVLREITGAIALPSFVCLFLLAGLAVRLWTGRRAALLGQARMAERNRIARELHDTVAHHVSAIAVQAQGGQVMLDTDPSAARQALEVIERQASSTLVEMRSILGVLRDQSRAELSLPPPGIDDITRLADDGGPGPAVEVTLSGELSTVGSSTGSALVRLAQEAVTNARRHASEATLVVIEVVGADDAVHLTVSDDGASTTQGTVGSGFGLLGMRERAALLGGHCVAGPAAGGGWVVRASLPRSGADR